MSSYQSPRHSSECTGFLQVPSKDRQNECHHESCWPKQSRSNLCLPPLPPWARVMIDANERISLSWKTLGCQRPYILFSWRIFSLSSFILSLLSWILVIHIIVGGTLLSWLLVVVVIRVLPLAFDTQCHLLYLVLSHRTMYMDLSVMPTIEIVVLPFI